MDLKKTVTVDFYLSDLQGCAITGFCKLCNESSEKNAKFLDQMSDDKPLKSTLLDGVDYGVLATRYLVCNGRVERRGSFSLSPANRSQHISWTTLHEGSWKMKKKNLSKRHR